MSILKTIKSHPTKTEHDDKWSLSNSPKYVWVIFWKSRPAEAARDETLAFGKTRLLFGKYSVMMWSHSLIKFPSQNDENNEQLTVGRSPWPNVANSGQKLHTVLEVIVQSPEPPQISCSRFLVVELDKQFFWLLGPLEEPHWIPVLSSHFEFKLRTRLTAVGSRQARLIHANSSTHFQRII